MCTTDNENVGLSPMILLSAENFVGETALKTTSPSIGAYADAVFELNSHLELRAKLFDAGEGLVIGGNLPSVNIDQELFAFNRDNDGEIRALGEPILEGTEFSVSLPLSKTPPLQLEMVATPSTDGFGLNETLSLVTDPAQLLKGAKVSPGIKDVASLSAELGTFSQSLPHIEHEVQTQDNGSVSSSSSDNVAEVDLQLGALLGLTKYDLAIGPANLSLTPISFQAGPEIDVRQEVGVSASSTVTYRFDRPTMVIHDLGFSGPSFPRQVTELEIPVGDDFEIITDGYPVEVTPTWNFNAKFTNDIDLLVQISGDLTVAEATLERKRSCCPYCTGSFGHWREA